MSSVWKVHLSSLVCAVNENVPTLPFELKANIDSHKRNFNLRRGFLACGRYVNKKDFFFHLRSEKKTEDLDEKCRSMGSRRQRVIGLKACSAVRRVYKHRFPSDSLLTFSHQRCRGKHSNSRVNQPDINLRWFMIDLKMFSRRRKQQIA